MLAPEVSLAIFYLVNAERRKCGLDTLEWDDALSKLAVFHAKDMVVEGFSGHVSPTYGSLQERISYFGLSAGKIYGENIAEHWEFGTVYDPAKSHRFARILVDSWLRSPNHKRNIMNTCFRKTGVGAVYAKIQNTGQTGWRLVVVQVFSE